jgi:TolA-binding protein
MFEKVESQIKQQQKDLFATIEPTYSGTIQTDLLKVIDKCSSLLQFNSESAYVDDALLIIGKAFYYKKDYQKAIRKFDELKANYPESDLILEADLWTGKSQMKLKNYDDGLAILDDVKKKAIDESEDDIIRDAFIEEIVYRIKIKDYESAIATANEFMKVSDDDIIKARVWYEIGKLNEQIGDVENAVVAYKNVFDFSPDFDLEYTASLNYGKALRESGKNNEALDVFNDMQSEDKYSDKLAEIELEIARTNRALGNYDIAVNMFTKIDTTYKNTPTSGAAKYELGELYEYNLSNLDSAASYYRKSASSTLPTEYIEPAKDKNSLFTRYTNLRNNISRFDRALFYSENPDEFVKDSIAYVEDSLAIQKELRKVKELQEIWSGLDSLLTEKDTTGAYADTMRAIDTLMVYDKELNKDTLLTKVRMKLPADSVILNRFDSLFTSEQFKNPLNQKVFQQNQQKSLQNRLLSSLPDTLRFKNNPPRKSNLSDDSLHVLLAKDELELGNLFLTEINIPDSAKWYYDNILQEYPGTQYQASTLYALGSYYLTVDNKTSADSLFNIIYDNYKKEKIVNAAANKLGKPYIDLNYDPVKDEYNEAENVFLDSDYDDAIQKFYEIYQTYPNSQYAAKALYASGWILENILTDPDSAVVIYDTLVQYYPASVYVKNVAGKLSVYNQEQKRIQTALLDSLNALNAALNDSLGIDSTSQLTQGELEATSDTVQVTMQNPSVGNEEKTTEYKTEQVKTKPISTVKEPLWNPRKRKH